MTYVTSFPVLVIVLALYLLMAATGGMMIDGDAYAISLASGAEMTLRGGDLFIVAGLVALTIDLIKMRIGLAANLMRIGLALAAIGCFVFLGIAGSVSFLLLTLMTLIELVAAATGTRRA